MGIQALTLAVASFSVLNSRVLQFRLEKLTLNIFEKNK